MGSTAGSVVSSRRSPITTADSLLALGVLFILGTLAFLLSTVAAGGGALVMIPLASLVLPVETLPPVIGIASLLSATQRVALYRRVVERSTPARDVPALLVGTVVGSLFLVQFVASRQRW